VFYDTYFATEHKEGEQWEERILDAYDDDDDDNT